MREIKFRAYDKKYKRWLTSISVFSDGSWYGTYDTTEGYTEEDGCVLMQFTGLKDKNGKEIYEGDVVKTPAGNGPIEWRNGCHWICWNAKDGTTLFDTPKDMIEVLGNIYENQDLLKLLK